mmetsp:Transcript_10124/g.26265  ORF Transcript_10124/g.26265 Transcript_10124/m.26265 type:complete len:222 (-) Transcript_10124:96-761(-)
MLCFLLTGAYAITPGLGGGARSALRRDLRLHANLAHALARPLLEQLDQAALGAHDDAIGCEAVCPCVAYGCLELRWVASILDGGKHVSAGLRGSEICTLHCGPLGFREPLGVARAQRTQLSSWLAASNGFQALITRTHRARPRTGLAGCKRILTGTRELALFCLELLRSTGCIPILLSLGHTHRGLQRLHHRRELGIALHHALVLAGVILERGDSFAHLRV